MAKTRTRRTVQNTIDQPTWRFVCRAEYLGHTIEIEELHRPFLGSDLRLNKPVRARLDGAIYLGYIGGADVTSAGCAIGYVRCALYQQRLAATKQEVA